MLRTGEREGSIACDASESGSKKDSFEVNCAIIVITQCVEFSGDVVGNDGIDTAAD